MALSFPGQASIPFEYTRWKLAEKFGWTLEYIDSLSLQDMQDYWQIQDGIGRADEIRKGRKR